MAKPTDEFYTPNELLSKKDINGCNPEIYISDGIRTTGKSTSYKRLVVNRFLKTCDSDHPKKFMKIVRNKNQMKDSSVGFFKNIKELFYPDLSYSEKPKASGLFYEYYINGLSAGYVVPLRAAKAIKEVSEVFVDVDSMIFDEFQPEDNFYLPGEVEKFQSIHMSVARGGGRHVRRVPVYMISNSVTLLNPYYQIFGIAERIRENTRFLRGDGWVFEFSDTISAIKAQQESAFNKAFSGTKYQSYARERVYLNDSTALIEKPKGVGKYMVTISVDGEKISVWNYGDIVFTRKTYDEYYPFTITTSVNDMSAHSYFVQTNSRIVSMLRTAFRSGIMRFDSLYSKNVMLKLLSY